MEFLWFILVGALAGWLAGEIVKGRSLGLFGNIIVGIIGGAIGGWLATKFQIRVTDGLLGNLITSTAGAVLLLLILSMFTGSRK